MVPYVLLHLMVLAAQRHLTGKCGKGVSFRRKNVLCSGTQRETTECFWKVLMPGNERNPQRAQRKTGAVVVVIPAVLPSITSPLSRKHAPSDMVENRRHSAGSFFHRACTITLRLFTLSAGMGAVAGNRCGEEGGSVAAREQKVIVQCPLTADVNQTKQSVMIKVFSGSSHGAKEVLGCDWLSRLGKFDCPPSLFQAELIAIHNDSVLASLPKHRLQKGAYRCQLVPYDRDRPFTDCTITEPEETTTESQVTPTTDVHHETDEHNSDLSNGPQEKSFACSADDQRGLVAAVVDLTITVFCLLMAMAAMVIYHLRYRGYSLEPRVDPSCSLKDQLEGWPMVAI
ncbi:hypothetical protein ACOMHN_060134 [Nucella lapillus]